MEEDNKPIGNEVDPDDGTLPQRMLSQFCFFDPNDRGVFVSLDHAEEGDNSVQLEGAGIVIPWENDDDDEAEDQIHMQLTAIMTYSIDYRDPSA